MTRYHTTRAPHCVDPRPHTDASQRYHTYGKVQSMDEPQQRSWPEIIAWCVLFLAITAAGIGGSATLSPPASEATASAVSPNRADDASAVTGRG